MAAPSLGSAPSTSAANSTSHRPHRPASCMPVSTLLVAGFGTGSPSPIHSIEYKIPKKETKQKTKQRGEKTETLYGLELPGRDHEGLSRGWGGGDGGQ